MTIKLSVLCLTASALVLAAPGYAATATAYLNWSNKQAVTAATVAVPASPYAIPPSPYGQVGDPYKRVLTWSNRNAQPAKPATAAQAQAAPEVASVTVPSQPLSMPQPSVNPAGLTLPSTPASQQGRPAAPDRRLNGRYVDTQPAPQTIEPEDDDVGDVAATVQPVPVSRPLPPVAPAAPPSNHVATVVSPAHTAPARPIYGEGESSSKAKMVGGAIPATVTASAMATSKPIPAPVVQQPAQDEAYQIPASSPYAARIAAARQALNTTTSTTTPADTAAPPAPQVASATPAKTKPVKGKTKAVANTATAPEPAEPLAAQETDHVFIPGEQYTNAADAPRYYSLVREYGLKPDPISVDTHATGALLAPLKDVKTSDDDSDDDQAKDDSAKDDSGDADKDDTAKDSKDSTKP